MFLVIGLSFLALLSLTLIMLWGYERLHVSRKIPRARLEEFWDGSERRQHIRFAHELDIDYRVEKKSRIKNGKSINISAGGMKLLLDDKLPQGAILGLKFYIPNRKGFIEVEGEVVWTSDADHADPSGKRLFHSGIKFMAIKELSGTHLSEYLVSLKVKDS